MASSACLVIVVAAAVGHLVDTAVAVAVNWMQEGRDVGPVAGEAEQKRLDPECLDPIHQATCLELHHQSGIGQGQTDQDSVKQPQAVQILPWDDLQEIGSGRHILHSIGMKLLVIIVC